MRQKILTFLVLAVFLLEVISAERVTIEIKTLANAEIQFNAYEEDNYRAPIENVVEYADDYGDWKIDLNIPTDTYSLRIFCRKDKKFIMGEEGYEETSIDVEDNPYYIEILPEGIIPLQNPNKTGNVSTEPIIEYVPQVTENLTSTPTSTPVSNKTDSVGTGKTILNEIGSSQTGYIIVAVLFLVVAGFLGFKIRKSSAKKEIKVVKLSERQKDEKQEEAKSSELQEAEEQLKKAQEKIQQLKLGNKSDKEKQIEEAKKKLIEDEQRLIRLRSEK